MRENSIRKWLQNPTVCEAAAPWPRVRLSHTQWPRKGPLPTASQNRLCGLCLCYKGSPSFVGQCCHLVVSTRNSSHSPDAWYKARHYARGHCSAFKCPVLRTIASSNLVPLLVSLI